MELLSTPQRVITFVLPDLVERKNPEFPVVHVAHIPSTEDRLPRKGNGVKGAAIEVLEEGTGTIFYTTTHSLKEAKKATRAELSSLGYTVYTGGPRRIYVLEFNSPFRGDSENTWLYVGETGKSVEARVAQHFSGIKAAKYWQQLLKRRPDLEPDKEFWSVEDSTEAEREWGRMLEEAGYRVRGPRQLGNLANE